jgi:ATP-binding protein involved in chromosome partitioning
MTIEPRTSVIDKRLKQCKKIIAVASGKGGVGKSLVASGLALNLSNKGYRVGLFDLDLYGPSSHIILGVKDAYPREEKGIIPPKVHGIKFMSIVYYTEDKPSAFRGIDISNIIIELLAITQWGSLDYLIIDMPPGIGDETLDVIRLIKRGEFLVVTTPSKVALGAVSKLLIILKELNIPILGVIENMTMKKTRLIEQYIDTIQLPYLESIPFDTSLEAAIGQGTKLQQTEFMHHLDQVIKNIPL